MGLFRCAHQWELLSKEVLPSEAETLFKAIKEAGAVPRSIDRIGSATASVVHILTCRKCGRLRHYHDSAGDW